MHNRPKSQRSVGSTGPQRGFTLIEVMVTVAIIAILSSIAYPSYTDYVRRGQLQEAFAALADYRVKLEQYFQDHKGYGTTAGDDCADAPDAPKWADFKPASAKFFEYSCKVNAAGDGYLLVAKGSGGLAIDHWYTVDEQGHEGTTRFKGTVVAKKCWLVRGSEC